MLEVKRGPGRFHLAFDDKQRIYCTRVEIIMNLGVVQLLTKINADSFHFILMQNITFPVTCANPLL